MTGTNKFRLLLFVMAFSFSVLMTRSTAITQNDSYTTREMTISNREQIVDLQRRIYNLEMGGSATAVETMRLLSVLRTDHESLRRDFDSLKTDFHGLLVFVFVQLAGLAWIGIRSELLKKARKGTEQ